MDKLSFEQQPTNFEQGKGRKEFEISGKHALPIIRLGEVSDDIVDEVQRAALVTLHELNIPLDRFTSSDPSQLVDVKTRNAQNLFTYERLPGSDLQIPVIVVSSRPLYDYKMRETIALYEPDNAKIFLNLRRIRDAFKGAANISVAQMAAIAAIEEVIHFVQDKYWKREWGRGNTDYQSEEFADLHDADPLEKEANEKKKMVYSTLYPELDIKVRGIDY
jgi:hypothetical protein